MSFNKLEQRDNFRWKRIKGAELEGKYDMPKLAPVHDIEPTKLIGFNQAKSIKNPEEWWFHFYVDDYHFERIWNCPKKYLAMLKRFQGGISTDYSIYLDMPKSQQIWNCWRNRSMAYWMQQNGMKIIPNAGWSDAESLGWAFDGLPEHSVLSITTQGCMGQDYVSKQSLVNGLHELVRQKEPEKLIVYGQFPDEWRNKFPMPVITYKSFAAEKWGA